MSEPVIERSEDDGPVVADELADEALDRPERPSASNGPFCTGA